MRMDDGLVEQTFRAIRWPDGKPVCPGCEGEKVYGCVRNRFRCAACRKVQIPTEAGRGFRFDVGQRSDLKPATIPI
jgi:hypothetical protein